MDVEFASTAQAASLQIVLVVLQIQEVKFVVRSLANYGCYRPNLNPQYVCQAYVQS